MSGAVSRSCQRRRGISAMTTSTGAATPVLSIAAATVRPPVVQLPRAPHEMVEAVARRSADRYDGGPRRRARRDLPRLWGLGDDPGQRRTRLANRGAATLGRWAMGTPGRRTRIDRKHDLGNTSSLELEHRVRPEIGTDVTRSLSSAVTSSRPLPSRPGPGGAPCLSPAGRAPPRSVLDPVPHNRIMGSGGEKSSFRGAKFTRSSDSAPLRQGVTGDVHVPADPLRGHSGDGASSTSSRRGKRCSPCSRRMRFTRHGDPA